MAHNEYNQDSSPNQIWGWLCLLVMLILFIVYNWGNLDDLWLLLGF